MNAYLFTDSIFSIVESAGISEVDSIIVLVSGLLLSICYSFFRDVLYPSNKFSCLIYPMI